MFIVQEAQLLDPQNGSETWTFRPCQTLREDSINPCIRAIEGMKSSPGPAHQDLPAVLENIAANGITIKMCENADLRFHDEVLKLKYRASLVTSLESRFTDPPIISCNLLFCLFDPSLFVSDMIK